MRIINTQSATHWYKNRKARNRRSFTLFRRETAKEGKERRVMTGGKKRFRATNFEPEETQRIARLESAVRRNRYFSVKPLTHARTRPSLHVVRIARKLLREQ